MVNLLAFVVQLFVSERVKVLCNNNAIFATYDSHRQTVLVTTAPPVYSSETR